LQTTCGTGRMDASRTFASQDSRSTSYHSWVSLAELVLRHGHSRCCSRSNLPLCVQLVTLKSCCQKQHVCCCCRCCHLSGCHLLTVTWWRACQPRCEPHYGLLCCSLDHTSLHCLKTLVMLSLVHWQTTYCQATEISNTKYINLCLTDSDGNNEITVASFCIPSLLYLHKTDFYSISKLRLQTLHAYRFSDTVWSIKIHEKVKLTYTANHSNS